MKKLKSPTRTRKTKSKQKGNVIMSTKHIVLAVVIVCAVLLGTLMMMGPKLGLQTPPIEEKAMTYLNEHKLIGSDETIAGFKAINYYNYDKAAVITDKRIFVYDNGKAFSIPLHKITSVFINDGQLGQQEVLITAQAAGVISLDVYRTSVPQLLQLLKVSSSIVKYNDTKESATQNTTSGKI